MKHIEKTWQEACDELYMDKLPADQIKQMRHLFFCGALTIYEVVAEAAVMDGDNFRKIFYEIANELKEFKDSK